MVKSQPNKVVCGPWVDGYWGKYREKDKSQGTSLQQRVNAIYPCVKVETVSWDNYGARYAIPLGVALITGGLGAGAGAVFVTGGVGAGHAGLIARLFGGAVGGGSRLVGATGGPQRGKGHIV